MALSQDAPCAIAWDAVAEGSNIHEVATTAIVGHCSGSFASGAGGVGVAAEALLVRGAGSKEADGVYKVTAREYCGAAVYEHSACGADLRITREPHKSAKTGQTKHGWLLGCRGEPLYGAPTESTLVPSTGWKKFGGKAPVPSVSAYASLAELYLAEADVDRQRGSEAMESGLWQHAFDALSAGIDHLKRSGGTGSAVQESAAALFGRRAVCCARLEQPRCALRDAAVARQLGAPASAEAVAARAAEDLGMPGDRTPALLHAINAGRLLDPEAPLAVRGVERWLGLALEALSVGRPMPAPEHLPADRFLDGLTEEQCEQIMRFYLPDEVKLDKSLILQDSEQCLAFMRKWEKVLEGDAFQQRKEQLWDRRDLSYPKRLLAIKEMVANALEDVLLEAGFERGLQGLARAIKEMQLHWSADVACAQKAEELEDVADVSLADLE